MTEELRFIGANRCCRADNENDYLVKYKGKVQELVHWTSDMTWDYGTVYQKESMRTTLSLVHPVDAGMMQERLPYRLSEN